MAAYSASTGSLTGSVSAQNLLALFNPSGGGLHVVPSLVVSNHIIAVLAVAPLAISLARISAAPTGGAALTIVSRATGGPAAIATATSLPTAVTLVAGKITTAFTGVVVTAAGANGPSQLDLLAGSSLVLAPGEGLVVQAPANLTTWSHLVNVAWDEVVFP